MKNDDLLDDRVLKAMGFEEWVEVIRDYIHSHFWEDVFPRLAPGQMGAGVGHVFVDLIRDALDWLGRNPKGFAGKPWIGDRSYLKVVLKKAADRAHKAQCRFVHYGEEEEAFQAVRKAIEEDDDATDS